MASQAWSVVSQTETMGITPTGSAAAGVKVVFKLADGTQGSVFVPDTQYNPDTVRSMVMERVAALSAVKGLSG